jgi:poly(A) polymerase Pap1
VSDTYIPIIHLELEQMRFELTQAIRLHHASIENSLNAQFKALIDGFDFDAVIRQEATRIIAESIRRALASAVWRAFEDGDVQAVLGADVRGALLEILKERSPKAEGK